MPHSCLVSHNTGPATSPLLTSPYQSPAKSDTVIPSCISILSKLIFTVTSLKRSPLSRLHIDILSTTLESIVNLLLLRSNWDPLDLHPHLNYYSLHISSFYSYPFFCSYSVLPSVQNPYKHNNSYYFYPHPWHIGFFEQNLPSVESAPLPPLSSPLSLLEQAWLSPIEKAFPVFLAILVVVLVIPIVPHYSILRLAAPGLVTLLFFLLPSCSPFNTCLN